MRVRTRKKGSIAIVDVVGELKSGNEVKLGEACDEILASGGRLVVINLLRVPWIGSEGLGEVLLCRKHIVEHGGRLKIVLHGKTHDLFVVCSLQQVLDLFEDLEDALASFADVPPVAGTASAPEGADMGRMSIA